MENCILEMTFSQFSLNTPHQFILHSDIQYALRNVKSLWSFIKTISDFAKYTKKHFSVFHNFFLAIPIDKQQHTTALIGLW
jgi:hypothetical protein